MPGLSPGLSFMRGSGERPGLPESNKAGDRRPSRQWRTRLRPPALEVYGHVRHLPVPSRVNPETEDLPCRNRTRTQPGEPGQDQALTGPGRSRELRPWAPEEPLRGSTGGRPGRSRGHVRVPTISHPVGRPRSGSHPPRRPCRQTSSWRATCSPRSTGPGPRSRVIPNSPESISQEPRRLWSGRTMGRSGDTYIATITTSPSVPHSIAVAATTGKSIRRSRSLKVTSGSRRTRSAVKTVAMTGTRNASWMDTEALVITTATP